MKTTLFVLFILMFQIPSLGQPQTIGERVHDYTFSKVAHYKTDHATISDFRGKWLFLNFWNQRCITNTSFLPDLGRLQHTFRDSMQFFTVAISGKYYPDVENIFETLQRKLSLDLTVAYDSVLRDKWEIGGTPFILIIDPEGIVRASLGHEDATPTNIRRIMNGDPQLPDLHVLPTFRYDVNRIGSPGDTTLVRRSVLSKWAGEQGVATRLSDYVKWPETDRRKVGVVYTFMTVPGLYATAYLGHEYMNAKYLDGTLYYPKVQIEVTSTGELSDDPMLLRSQDHYSYRLDLPPHESADVAIIQDRIKKDLAGMFPYSISMKTKKMVVWRLLAKRGAAEKLRTGGAPESIEINPLGMDFVNTSMDRFCHLVISYLTKSDRIFIEANETGISGNIDAKLDAIINDKDEMNKALSKYGLFLRKEKVKMKVLVLKTGH